MDSNITGSAQATQTQATTIAGSSSTATTTTTTPITAATTTVTTAAAIATAINTLQPIVHSATTATSLPTFTATPTVLTSTGSVVSLTTTNLGATSAAAVIQQQQQQQQLLSMDITKEDTNNLSLASAMSEGQRSHSGAPSASSSPILSPPGKIFGRNANGTMIATSRPSNEAEIQLYRVLQRASLLSYYDTLLEMGGDDVQQLYEAGEEEFLEIMALVGMASKPLHVRRLQKVLHEWANNPALFQGPMMSGSGALCETTPTKPTAPMVFKPEPSPTTTHLPRTKFPAFTPSTSFNPTPLINTSQTSSSHLLSQMCTPAITVPVIQPHTSVPLPTNLSTSLPTNLSSNLSTSTTLPATHHQASGSTAHQVTSSSPQLTPVLTEMQVNRITLGAEKIARQLPQREPRAQTSKKRTSRELEQVIAMSEHDPRRMDEIRKYSAIYGRFDCKRRPEKPLTLHEVCVNEAAAQLCRLVPALLTRRDELFPLARQIVKDAGFGHSASIARYGALMPQLPAQSSSQRTTVVVDCESSDSAVSSKRQRLSSTETSSAPDLSRETADDSRYNLFAMYQKFAKPPFDLADIAKFSMGKSEIDDNDNDSRFSYSNSSSPSMPHNGFETERESMEQTAKSSNSERTQSHLETHSAHSTSPLELRHSNRNRSRAVSESDIAPAFGGGVQVLSAAGGHIIAVANPALMLSPTLNEALSLKREAESPEM